MSKKMMLLALAVVSAAFFALPAIASAQEIHIEPGNGEIFSISSAGVEARAQGEPTVTCTGMEGEGAFDVGSSTTGVMEREYTGCHVNVFFTIACHSEGALANNTVVTSGAFHVITWKDATNQSIPALLMTTDTVHVICSGISTLTFTGAVIGTITSPNCGGTSNTLTLSVTATGTTQNHLTYTGVNYDLQSRTGTNAQQTAALVGTATATSLNEQKLNCT